MDPREVADQAIGLFVEALERQGVGRLSIDDDALIDTAKAQALNEISEGLTVTDEEIGVTAPTPEVDYDRLNDVARLLYDAAHARGYTTGYKRGQHDSGIRAARSMLEVISHLLGGAGRATDEEETRRWTLAVARMALGKVPLMNVSEQVHTAKNALDGNFGHPRISNVRDAQAAVYKALEKLA